jgi:formylglycine-generating enzyme required for sulfatase activity
MAGIFINYRRDDAPGVDGRLGDRLAKNFSRRAIFMDVDAMRPGLDFVKQLEEQVSKCDVLLAIIGPNWSKAADEKGQRRLDQERDYVRIEIASALKREIPVIPVLVNGAVMPSEEDLPDDLKPLINRHALELRHTRFDGDSAAIIDGLTRVLPQKAKWPWIAGGAGLAAAIIVGGIALWPILNGSHPIKSSVVEDTKPSALAVKPPSDGLSSLSANKSPVEKSASEVASAPAVVAPVPKPLPTSIAASAPPLASVGQGGQVFRDCAQCPVMVVIPAGSGLIGSPVSESGHESSEEPRRSIRFTRPFAVSRDSITFAEWDSCVAEGGCENFIPGDMGWGRGPQPLVLVSWNDAKSYVAWLSKKTNETYRLLSESEWEFSARACRSATCNDWTFWFGDVINPDLANYDWRYSYAGGRKAQAPRKPQPTNTFSPNTFGLFNMAGNVAQWVEDCWNSNLRDLPGDGSARMSGDCSAHVIRGGSWNDDPVNLRSAARKYDIVSAREPNIGFRVARELSR